MLLLSALISDSKYFMLKELKSVISHFAGQDGQYLENRLAGGQEDATEVEGGVKEKPKSGEAAGSPSPVVFEILGLALPDMDVYQVKGAPPYLSL